MLKFKTNHHDSCYIVILTYEEFLDYVSDNRNPDRNQEILKMLANSGETSLMPTIWFNDSDCTKYSHVTYSTNTLVNIEDWAIYIEKSMTFLNAHLLFCYWSYIRISYA